MVATGEEPALAAMHAEPARLAHLLRSARRTYTAVGLRSADALSARWAHRAESPYGAAVTQVGRAMDRPGA